MATSSAADGNSTATNSCHSSRHGPLTPVTTTTRQGAPWSTILGSPSRRDVAKFVLAALLVTLVVVEVVGNGGSGGGSDDPNDGDDVDGVGSGVPSWMYRQVRRRLYEEEHKSLLPLDRSDRYGFVAATLGLMIAAGGGIGGGGVLVPIYILVMGFNPKHAIPLSNVTVLGGAVANTLLNWPKRHPSADRPLVDWDLILIMEPLTIGGALIGAFLNKLLPEKVLVVMLVLLLSFTSYKTLTKAVKMYKKESIALGVQKRGGGRGDVKSLLGGGNDTKESELTRMAHSRDDDDEDEAGESLLDHMEDGRGEDDEDDGDEGDKEKEEKVAKEVEEDDYLINEDTDEDRAVPAVNKAVDADRRRQILEEERQVAMGNVMVLVGMFVVVLFINVMKGGGAFPSPLGIRCGSPSFWAANAIMLGWIVIVSLFCRLYLIYRCREKERVDYPYVEGDIKWDARATFVYPLICCLAGFFAGMFGIGGGIVKGPLMLAMGVHPAVSSASSACMILFTSFTATTSFVVFGLLIPDYAIVCLIIGFCATLAGQIGLSYLMKKYQRNSYIAFSIGAIVLLSAFLMTVQSLVSIAEGKDAPSGGICGTGH